MTSLDGYFQLLEESREEEERTRYLTIIQERISNLKDMLEELFTFTKLKNESYQLELIPCCINRILKDTIFSYYENWNEQGIEPQIQMTQEPLYMEGNVQALRRVIQNIIKNGLDHGEEKIGIHMQRVGNQICIEIRNQVTNPEQIDISQVFERFYKADTARGKGSTGLGLSIAREFVLRMKGQVQAYIREDEFCIEIRFPCMEEGGL